MKGRSSVMQRTVNQLDMIVRLERYLMDPVGFHSTVPKGRAVGHVVVQLVDPMVVRLAGRMVVHAAGRMVVQLADQRVDHAADRVVVRVTNRLEENATIPVVIQMGDPMGPNVVPSIDREEGHAGDTHRMSPLTWEQQNPFVAGKYA
jgi:hypothetical protein